MQKNVQKAKRFFISQSEIRNRHPEDVPYSTDADYARLASVLRMEIEKANISDLTDEDKLNLALNLAMYQEDVISGAGIWYAFTELMHTRYGKYVPFYPMDEDYLRDEPNFQDVAFIIWYTLIRHRHGHRQITNPETPALMELAAELYKVMLEWFDRLPVNDDLRMFFEQATFADDFERQRKVLLWFVLDCYLTYDTEYDIWLDDEVERLLEFFQGKEDHAECVAQQELAYGCRVGPLALYPKEWLAALLRANHNEKCAVRVESQEYRRADFFRMENLGPDSENLSCEGLDGTRFIVTKSEFGRVPSFAVSTTCASVVNYDGTWYMNGSSVSYNTPQEKWSRLRQECENRKEEDKALRERMEALVKESGGSPFLFFENVGEMRECMTGKLKLTKKLSDTYLSESGVHGHGVFGLLPKSSNMLVSGELCAYLCDGRNPYYDRKQAEKDGFDKAMNMSPGLLHYAMQHGLLPDVGMKSVYGAERGQSLFRDNYDFLQRAIMGNDLMDD